MTARTPFGEILRRAVIATPGAIGGAFADADGELVDSFSRGDRYEWAVLTAHYGVVLAQLHAWLGTCHFGGTEYFIAQHTAVDVIVYALPGGYYALLAVAKPTPPPLGAALLHLREAARALQQELA
jgi:hypothetical protein